MTRSLYCFATLLLIFLTGFSLPAHAGGNGTQIAIYKSAKFSRLNGGAGQKYSDQIFDIVVFDRQTDEIYTMTCAVLSGTKRVIYDSTTGIGGFNVDEGNGKSSTYLLVTGSSGGSREFTYYRGKNQDTKVSSTASLPTPRVITEQHAIVINAGPNYQRWTGKLQFNPEFTKLSNDNNEAFSQAVTRMKIYVTVTLGYIPF